MTTYVHEGVEVAMTGRTANRKIPTRPNAKEAMLTLVEIEPIDKSFDWKKWVDPRQLYVVSDEEKA